MAQRFWVGDSGEWGDTSHWSASSGGAGGASVPTSSDDAVIDSNSFTVDNQVISGSNSVSPYTINVKSFNASAASRPFVFNPGTVGTFGTSVRLNLYGNMTLSSLMSMGANGNMLAEPFDNVTFTQNSAELQAATQRFRFYIASSSMAGKTLKFTGDTIINAIQHQAGILDVSGINLQVAGISSTGSSTRTLNLTNTVLTTISGVSATNNFELAGSNLALQATGSIINLNVGSRSYATNGRTLPTVNVTAPSALFPVYVNFTGSNTINVLTVSRHMTLQAGSTLTVNKLVAYGSPSDKTRIYSQTGGSQATIAMSTSNQLVAAEDIDLKDIIVTGLGTYHAGSTSTNSGNNTGWSFTDAPAVQTFQDDFTGGTVDSSKWGTSTSGNGNISQSSGKITLKSTSSFGGAILTAKNQYVLEDSRVQFKLERNLSGGGSADIYVASAQSQYGVSNRRNIPSIYLNFSNTQVDFIVAGISTGVQSHTLTANDIYWRILEDNGVVYLDSSIDGITYSNITSLALSSYGISSVQLLGRPIFSIAAVNSTEYIAIDDLNIDLEPAADFIATPTSGNTPLNVSFSDRTNFPADTWDWDFGDGDSSSLQNPTHIYDASGTYSVSLEASNDDFTESVTKTNLITVLPNTYSRSISGTLLFGGSVTRGTLTAYRSISGTLLFGGTVRAVVIKDTESIEEKRYLYKIYDSEGTFIEVWNDVISEPEWTEEINEIGSVTTVELARNSDSLGTTTAPLLTEDDDVITTEDNFPILASVQSRNQVGEGSSVMYNNRVDIWVYYGGVEPLLTEDGEIIYTEDDEPILATIGAPNGRRIFTGFVSNINSRYGNTETTSVEVTSYGWDLNQYPIIDDDGKTTVAFNSLDPSEIVRRGIDKFVEDSTAEQVTYTNRSTTSVSNTSTVVSYTFRNNTYADLLKKSIELMPSAWYFRVDLGDNLVYVRPRSDTPQHLFYLGKHIKALDLRGSILDSVNRVLFTGGGDPALYKDYSEAPAQYTRRSLEQYSDARVELESSADIISEGIIEQANKIKYRSTVEILAKQYDIESIQVGDVVGFRNFDNFVDLLQMQIVGKTYTPDVAQLQLDTIPPTMNKRLEDIRRNLVVQENQNIPDTPDS